MPRSLFLQSLPFVPALAGLALSIGRFRVHEPVSGIACVIAGLLLMVVVVFRLPGANVGK